jgi:hypothetical protein
VDEAPLEDGCITFLCQPLALEPRADIAVGRERAARVPSYAEGD